MSYTDNGQDPDEKDTPHDTSPLLLGDRTFSKWGGSVVDSVVGAFLTQNVTDYLSRYNTIQSCLVILGLLRSNW